MYICDICKGKAICDMYDSHNKRTILLSIGKPNTCRYVVPNFGPKLLIYLQFHKHIKKAVVTTLLGFFVVILICNF